MTLTLTDEQATLVMDILDMWIAEHPEAVQAIIKDPTILDVDELCRLTGSLVEQNMQLREVREAIRKRLLEV